MKNEVAHPESKDAKYVLKKLLPILNTSEKHTLFGNLERNTSLGETYARICRFGPQFEFLTIDTDNVRNPHIFRLVFSQPGNIKFPRFSPE